MALSRKFHWVKVNRDRTPEIPQRFNVSAYPSLLVLGHDDENIYRFQSFQEPPEFAQNLREGLSRWELYEAGEDYGFPPERPDRITDAGELRTLPAPSDAVPSGVAFLEDTLWVAQGDVARALDPETGAVQRELELPRMSQDLATDGTSLYVLGSGWSRGEPIRVLDPETGETVREIVTEANVGEKASNSRGLAWVDGRLHVLGIYGRIDVVHPKTGEVERSMDIGQRWTFGLAFDGEHLVAGSREALLLVDPGTGEIVRRVPVNYRLRAVGWHAGEYLLMEQPVFGFGKKHERIQVFPEKTVIHLLRLAR